MEYIIGIDDTDNLESRGTGHLARVIATVFSPDFKIHGVTRHQLLDDPRVPKTAKNSCAGILFSGQAYDLEEIAQVVRKIMLDDFIPGSDPGLCVATHVPLDIMAYGQRVKHQLVSQLDARQLVENHGIHLEGLGGSQDGVIGALAAVGLAASGNDGRYVQIGGTRDLDGLQPVQALLDAGIEAVQTLDGRPVESGMVWAEKIRPARREGVPILFVNRENNHWLPLKLD